MTQKPDRMALFSAAAGLALAAGAASGEFVAFGEPVHVETAGYAWSIAAGDFNGDGLDDIVHTGLLGELVVLLAGGGGFGEPLLLSTAADEARSDPRAADVDGDGSLDVIVGTSGGAMIFYGNGDGTFGPVVFLNGEPTEGVAVGDLNGDGLPDVVLTTDVVELDPEYSENEIVVYLNTGGRSFTAQAPIAAAHAYFFDLALGDLDGDRVLDLVAVAPGLRTLAVFRGHGDGSFGSPDHLPTTENAITVRLGDLDGDGKLDIANTNGNNCSAVNIHLNYGDGTFGELLVYVAGSPHSILQIGDINGDGIGDLVTAGQAVGLLAESWVVAISNGDGTFRPGQTFPIGGGAMRGTLGDFDGDGDLDFAAAIALEKRVTVLANETAGAEEPCPADFDGSGTADVNDLLGFLGTFRTQGAGSDFDGNGSVDVNDLLGFLGAFRIGCPA